MLLLLLLSGGWSAALSAVACIVQTDSERTTETLDPLPASYRLNALDVQKRVMILLVLQNLFCNQQSVDVRT